MIWVTLVASTGGSLTNLEKTWKPGSADVDALGLDVFFGEGLLQALEHGGLAGGVGGTFETEGFDGETFEQQAAGVGRLKLRQLEAARPEIHRQK